MKDNFHEKLKKKMDEYVHFVYKITKDFPKEEIFGVTSQIRTCFAEPCFLRFAAKIRTCLFIGNFKLH